MKLLYKTDVSVVENYSCLAQWPFPLVLAEQRECCSVKCVLSSKATLVDAVVMSAVHYPTLVGNYFWVPLSMFYFWVQLGTLMGDLLGAVIER